MDPPEDDTPAHDIGTGLNPGQGSTDAPGSSVAPSTLDTSHSIFPQHNTATHHPTWHTNIQFDDDIPSRNGAGFPTHLKRKAFDDLEGHSQYFQHAQLLPMESQGPLWTGNPTAQSSSTAQNVSTLESEQQQQQQEQQQQQQQQQTFGGSHLIPFDIDQALQLVATRPHPQTGLQAIQPIHPFVVADTWQQDVPVIFVSNAFEALTGYSRTEILGRNCRFLQSPDGDVQPMAPRQHVDSLDAYHFKLGIASGREFRQTIGNFKRGGQPFVNLITIIPIPWCGAMGRYLFGYHVDTTHTALTPSNFVLNIGGRNSLFSRRAGQQSETSRSDPDPSPQSSSATPVDDADLDPEILSRLLDDKFASQLGMPAHMSLCKIILDMVVGIVQVLSLTGTIVWISNSCRQLGYAPTELVGLPVQDKCHPADVSALFRQLKAATSGQTIELISRFRRSDGEYVWLHNVGSLLQLGGGRKVAVIAGLQEAVPNLSTTVLESRCGEQDVWVKMSVSGLILNVFPQRMTALGTSSQALVGTTFSNMLSDGPSHERYDRLLKSALSRVTLTITLELKSATGQYLQTEATMFSSDGPRDQRPHVLILHCRIIKSTKKKGKNPQVDFTSSPSPSADNLLEALNATEFGVWQVETHNLVKENDILRLELGRLQVLAKQRKLLKRTSKAPFEGCANCHTRGTPEWRRGPSGQRDLCNRCGLRFAKQQRADAAKDESDVMNAELDATQEEQPKEQHL